MFLDIVLYAHNALDSRLLSNSPLEDMKIWLANIHGMEVAVVKQKIEYFRKSAMLNIEREEIIIHDLYKEYAKWALKHVINSKGLVGVWFCEFSDLGNLYLSIPEELQSSPSGKLLARVEKNLPAAAFLSRFCRDEISRMEKRCCVATHPV